MNDQNQNSAVDGKFEVVPPEPGLTRVIKALLVAVVGVIATLYLLNPTAGFIELIPDNIPVIGNLDEAGATVILMSCLGYFGIDLTQLFRRRNSTNTQK